MNLTLTPQIRPLRSPPHSSVCLGFLRFLSSPLFPKTFAAAKGTTFIDNEDHPQHNGQEEADHIQRVVLVPGEVVGRGAQVRRSLVPHHELHPEHGQVQRLDGAVLVKAGEAHDVFLVAAHKDRHVSAGDTGGRQLPTLCASSETRYQILPHTLEKCVYYKKRRTHAMPTHNALYLQGWGEGGREGGEVKRKRKRERRKEREREREERKERKKEERKREKRENWKPKVLF